MSTMQSEVYEALRAIDIPEEKALKAASALSRRDEDVASLRSDTSVLRADVHDLKQDVSVLKRDVSILQSDMHELKQDVGALKQDIGSLKRDFAVMKWMISFVLAFQGGIFAKLFLH